MLEKMSPTGKKVQNFLGGGQLMACMIIKKILN
ncbi:MAG: hypothetical protein CM15mV31_0720 [uncultured marine virus]|nr:MAG: hypothetical protein CM15mV31_0720 [uncultured marine virus]